MATALISIPPKYSNLSNVEGHGRHEKGEEDCSTERAMQSDYILNQDSDHVTKSHVKIQFTVYRVNQGARLALL
jgi:hypothetical protein